MAAEERGEQYILNPPNATRDYDGVELSLRKRYSNEWQYAHINMIGRFPLERRLMFKFQSTIRGPFGINFATYARFMSGQRYTRQVRSQDLPITLSQGRETIYAENRGSSHYDPLYLVDLRKIL